MKEFEVGEEVYSILKGPGEVVEVAGDDVFSIKIDYEFSSNTYLKNGKDFDTDLHPALFHTFQEMKDYFSNLEEPKKKKTIKVESWLNIYSDGVIYQYSTKEDADGSAADGRIDCIHICKEYEVDE